MTVAVVGAGAVGCFLASRLTLAGHACVLIGRPRQVEAIRQRGLVVREEHHTRRLRVPASTELAEHPELILLAVQSQDLEAACEQLVHRAGGVPAVVLQNGVRADAIAGRVLGAETIVGGVVMSAVTSLEPGDVGVGVSGWLVLGRPAGGRPACLDMAVRTLRAALPTYLSTNLVGLRWAKLISNLNNGLTAATGLTLAGIARTSAGAWLVVHVMREGRAVADAAGIRLDGRVYGMGAAGAQGALFAVLQAGVGSWLLRLPPVASARLLSIVAHGPAGRLAVRGSTWQSLVRGRPTEIDYLNGEIVRTGEGLGIATPFNRRVVEVVHAVERSGCFEDLTGLWPPGVSEAVA